MTPEDIERALAGDPVAMKALIERALAGDLIPTKALVERLLLPTIQKEVALALQKPAAREGRDPRQEILDLAQDVLLSLFDDDGRLLRAWSSERSAIKTYVRLVSRCRALDRLRTKSRNPFTELLHEDPIDAAVSGATDPETSMATKTRLQRMCTFIETSQGSEGLLLFSLVFVEDRPVEEITAMTGKSRDAIYAWKSRIIRSLRKQFGERLEDPSPPRSIDPPRPEYPGDDP